MGVGNHPRYLSLIALGKDSQGRLHSWAEIPQRQPQGSPRGLPGHNRDPLLLPQTPNSSRDSLPLREVRREPRDLVPRVASPRYPWLVPPYPNAADSTELSGST